MPDDIEFNIMFCELIEKYPAIYDYNRQDYCNRNVLDNVWQTVAAKLNKTVTDCKDRWKNIRGRYSKYKKTTNLPSGSGVKSVKVYYLASHLHFLDNFLKSRTPKSNIKRKLDNKEDDYINCNDENESDISEAALRSPVPCRAQSPDLSTQCDPVPTPTNSKVSQATISKKKKMCLSLSEVNKTAMEYFDEKKKKLAQKSSSLIDPDLGFLQSVLPDMKAMADNQKRRFKMGILQFSSQILEESSPDASSLSLANGNGYCSSREDSVSRMVDSVSQEAHNTTSTFHIMEPYSPVSSVSFQAAYDSFTTVQPIPEASMSNKSINIFQNLRKDIYE